MFNIPFYRTEIPKWDIHKEDVLFKLHENLDGYIEKHECMTSFYTVKGNLNLSLKLFKPFLDFINPSLNHLREIESMSGGYPIPEISHIWYQSYTKQQYHQLHNHGALGWSAIFYAIFDKKEHRPTTFYAPFSDVLGEIIEYEPDVNEGTLLIFPSFLQHEARSGMSDKERVIISFNMSPISPSVVFQFSN